ncbi:MAG: EAL domain-containing protein [Methylococcaceae bacterium]
MNVSTDSVFCIGDDVIEAATANWSLCFEWTEDYATNGRLNLAAERLVEWRKQYGVLISVDDVGAGMDGLLRISLTQPDVLKIDGNFLELAMSSLENKAILQYIIKHFTLKNITVVAEHIETSRHLSFARSIGCNVWRGFWSRDSGIVYFKKNTQKIKTGRKNTSFGAAKFVLMPENMGFKPTKKMKEQELIAKIAQETNLHNMQVDEVLKSLTTVIKD